MLLPARVATGTSGGDLKDVVIPTRRVLVHALAFIPSILQTNLIFRY